MCPRLYLCWLCGGKRHGVGTLVFDSGIFEGQWVRGEASGSGLAARCQLLQCQRGSKQSRVTVAQVRFTNGDKFEGQYSGNRKHGFGTYAWADGAVEEGQRLLRIAGSA